MSELVSPEVVGHLRIQSHLLRRSAEALRDRIGDGDDADLDALRRAFHAQLMDYLALVDGVVDALRPDSPEPGATIVRGSGADEH